MLIKRDEIARHRIGVLAGGCSSERDISIKSGRAVFDALKEEGLNAVFIDLEDECVSFLDNADIDVVFIALHGRFGEDGALQEQLEKRAIPYTGSGPESSRKALDKLASKELFINSGLLVPDFRTVSNLDVPPIDLDFPCVVKPQHEGSSIGLTRVFSSENIMEAIATADKYEGDVIIEEYIPGREITVGILDEEALPVVEVITSEGVYDFSAKYEALSTEYVIPARIEEKLYKEIQDAGLRAHSALGCKGFSRVDMRLDADNRVYILEVNTVPGLTERSLLPMAGKAAGIGFPELCMRILGSAFSSGVAG